MKKQFILNCKITFLGLPFWLLLTFNHCIDLNSKFSLMFTNNIKHCLPHYTFKPLLEINRKRLVPKQWLDSRIQCNCVILCEIVAIQWYPEPYYLHCPLHMNHHLPSFQNKNLGISNVW